MAKLRSTLFLLILITLESALLAQDIAMSLPDKFSIRNQDFEILGRHNGLIYVYKSGTNEDIVETYRSNLGLKWKKFIDFDYRESDVEQLLFDDGEFILFYTTKVKTTKYIKAYKFNSQLVRDTTLYEIDTIKKKISEKYPYIFFEESDDHSKILVYYMTEKQNKDTRFTFILMNRDLEVLDSKTILIPTSGRRTIFEDVLVDDNGRVYIIIGEYKDALYSNANKYWVLSSVKEFEKMDHLEIQSERYYLNNAKFKIDNQNRNLVVAGFYSQDIKNIISAEGIFFYTFDLNTAERTTNKYQSFTPEFVAKIEGSGNKNEKIYSFVIDDIVLRRDGGGLIIAESYRKELHARYPDGYSYDPYRTITGSDTRTTYYFEEMLVLSVHPDGEIHWKNVLVKNQISSNDAGRHSSYILMNSGASINFIYNDEINHKTNVIQYLIGVTGQIDREILFNSNKYDLYLMPQLGKQISLREVVIPSYKKNKLRLVKLTY